MMLVNKIVGSPIGISRRRVATVVLLVLGVVADTAGSYSLHS